MDRTTLCRADSLLLTSSVPNYVKKRTEQPATEPNKRSTDQFGSWTNRKWTRSVPNCLANEPEDIYSFQTGHVRFGNGPVRFQFGFGRRSSPGHSGSRGGSFNLKHNPFGPDTSSRLERLPVPSGIARKWTEQPSAEPTVLYRTEQPGNGPVQFQTTWQREWPSADVPNGFGSSWPETSEPVGAIRSPSKPYRGRDKALQWKTLKYRSRSEVKVTVVDDYSTFRSNNLAAAAAAAAAAVPTGAPTGRRWTPTMDVAC